MAPAGYLDRGTELFKKLKSYYTQDTHGKNRKTGKGAAARDGFVHPAGSRRLKAYRLALCEPPLCVNVYPL
ncbi:hypothetical protein LTR28_000628 [Elasticomyces elasticus]|nr:hypothetical protein LTR28_000628 [Elasticomyces elasticus]